MVKPYPTLLMVLGLIYSCQPDKEKQPTALGKNNHVPVTTDSLQVDSVQIPVLDTICDCTFEKFSWGTINRGRSINTDLDDSTFKMYAHDSVRYKITSLHVNSDTILPKYRIFKNIHTIYLGHKTAVGLNNFPNIKHLICFGTFDVNMLGDATWLKNIETMMIGKSVVKGFTSFKLTPKLKYITAGHSSFDAFPTDLENAPCLQEISLGAIGSIHGHQQIDLTRFDLMKAPCLRIFHFDTYYSAYTGLPKNVLKSKVQEFYVYSKLNDEEKVEYEKIKKVKKVRR